MLLYSWRMKNNTSGMEWKLFPLWIFLLLSHFAFPASAFLSQSETQTDHYWSLEGFDKTFRTAKLFWFSFYLHRSKCFFYTQINLNFFILMWITIKGIKQRWLGSLFCIFFNAVKKIVQICIDIRKIARKLLKQIVFRDFFFLSNDANKSISIQLLPPWNWNMNHFPVRTLSH